MDDMNELDRREKLLLQRKKYNQHFKLIRFLKFFLPTLSVVLLSWLFFSSWVRIKHFSKPAADFLNFEFMVINKFILSDYSRDKKRYSLSAKRAQDNEGSKNTILLQDLELVMPIPGYDEMRLLANYASFDLYRNMLNIQHPFKIIFNNNDTQLYFKTAVMDIKKIVLNSSDAVKFTSSTFTLSAQSCSIENDQKRAIFSGDVSVVIHPKILHKKV
ncbi:hypothetical protein CKC_00795 [Candidatus Liberibacter solanacearum CLso-ZC1]|uniref:Uncharacterized protein n=1 Tax=Liberibacter solanacearum (strain CLso-ZC1) TaxID=658172 RepID=E4UC20_LIBSC|nr:LPS export ABC transporter periplasmic protein LptC [Candidatus Liberibacter solanacearum]ADR51910.1 hypothetical protein CKC_00795 [Candidatus Liberibacter solanacearum CLso-ZC1]